MKRQLTNFNKYCQFSLQICVNKLILILLIPIVIAVGPILMSALTHICGLVTIATAPTT